MAGKYSRFKNEGYRLPKYLLPWGNRSILSEILLTMHKHFKDVYLIMNKNDNDYKVHIKNIMKEYNINLNNPISSYFYISDYFINKNKELFV